MKGDDDTESKRHGQSFKRARERKTFRGSDSFDMLCEAAATSVNILLRPRSSSSRIPLELHYTMTSVRIWRPATDINRAHKRRAGLPSCETARSCSGKIKNNCCERFGSYDASHGAVSSHDCVAFAFVRVHFRFVVECPNFAELHDVLLTAVHLEAPHTSCIRLSDKYLRGSHDIAATLKCCTYGAKDWER